MLFKLSIKNIKKSIKDYSIYFFTLIFAVSMFYMFNSIDAQKSMLVLNDSKYQIINALVVLINYVSIFVSIILGFLIVYSNNFLIKKRKKEIGLYEILGMSKRKVSLILVIETIIIGLVSLIVGLLFGVFISQFLSIVVSKLFEVNMNNYKFVFSILSFKKTILYFGIIYLLVVLFNTITLSRYKLIDLINAEKKNEQIKIKSKFVTIFSFVLCVLFMGYAYYLLLHDNALLMFDNKMIIMIISGAIGTLLLFFSLSGFILKIIQRVKKVYYKGLNIFTLKQVNSKINTTVISTTVICLMLLLTIGMLSGSMSLAKVFNTDFSENNLVDYTILLSNTKTYVNDNLEYETINTTNIQNFESKLNKDELSKYTSEYALVHKYYDKNIKIKDLITKEGIEKLRKEYGDGISLDGSIPIISETDYKNVMSLIGKDYIDINDNEYLILCNVDFIIDSYKTHYTNSTPLTINGKILLPGSDAIIKVSYENSASAGNDGVIVVSDNIVKGLDLINSSMVGKFNDNSNNNAESLHTYIDTLGSALRYRTREDMEASSLGLKTMVIFIGLYLGIIFAISSATVLAIGQLSESSDNKKRYKVLLQIGADQKIINKALFTQIAITFMFPLVVALIHAYFGLKKLNALLISIGSIDLASNILLTTLFMIIVYGGYFLITYISSKNIIKMDKNDYQL